MEETNFKPACAHGKYDFVSMWEVVGKTQIRRKCQACGYMQDGEVIEWENSPNYHLTNSQE